MQDILKALVSSRQQGNAGQGADPMASLVGGLLGGSQSGGQQGGMDLGSIANIAGSLLGGAQGGQQPQAGGLGGVMGALEGIMGGQGAGSSDPIMLMLQPFVTPLAKKANIPPEAATIVVSFVAHQLLSHHPTSGRDSSHFNLEDLLAQVNSGKIDPNMLHNSGMVKQIAQKTGLDEATAEKALQTGFSLVGKEAAALLAKK